MRLSLIIVGIALLAVLGVTLTTTNFTAYLGDDPTACNNCHVMDAAYEGWYHGGHQDWATCNDCHTPHDFIPKYIAKTEHGIRHVSAFTLDAIPNPLRATAATRHIIQENCIRCHTATVESVAAGEMDAERYCFECHRDVAHGPRGISLLPFQDSIPYSAPEISK